ncbi:hypothetical protein EYC84_002129 [Monilinia fructicola]|uniref:3-phytase n=1 Tax=Monilinia fructicola TaxID=38448 RepID=A0A5M9JRU7_MONFR|nr:hypothetical protein EYC84_002129 [Monilinia fructicola]
MRATSLTTPINAGLLLISLVRATTSLAPEQDIFLPSSEVSTNPLTSLGANSPYFKGPNVYRISNQVPESCYVEQVAYNVRHGSRYPDSGAYEQWTSFYAEIQAANFNSTGPLAFLKSWKPVLTNPDLQIAQESPTGYKEAYDLGYQLRTRYPNLYSYGQPFISWANLYPRVVQTAQNFVRGFLGSTASRLAIVVTINSTGSDAALFDSLSPSDLCPAFLDGNGGKEQVTWNSIYLPPIQARLQSLITGNLNFSTTDVSIMPYLWPGQDLPSKMMLPYLNALADILDQGPGVSGTFANLTSYTLPNILTAFMNDGQITELGAATGVWDHTKSLGDGTKIPHDYEYISSHFVTMRGTVAFERLNCIVPGNSTGPVPHSYRNISSSTSTNATYIRILLNDVVYPVHSCQSGPGSSCLLKDYSALIKTKVEEVGDLPTRCNVTASDAPTRVKGASFFTDLSLSWFLYDGLVFNIQIIRRFFASINDSNAELIFNP